MTQREENRSLYLSYLEFCNEHDVEGMASFYTSTIKVNDVPMGIWPQALLASSAGTATSLLGTRITLW